MGRLKCAPSLLSTAPSKLGRLPDDKTSRERERNDFNPLRKLYNTARWRALRLFVFARDLFTCHMCGRIEGDTSKLVADHDRPHRGDLELFWDPENLKTLCASPCHSKHKQRQEQASEFR